MVPMVVRQGGWTASAVAKDTQGKVDKLLKAAKGTVERQNDSPTERDNLLFFWGMMKR
jgi:hypothetical protein